MRVHTTHQKKDRFSLVLSGGKPPVLLYQHLSQQSIEWQKVDLFWGDDVARNFIEE